VAGRLLSALLARTCLSIGLASFGWPTTSNTPTCRSTASGVRDDGPGRGLRRHQHVTFGLPVESVRSVPLKMYFFAAGPRPGMADIDGAAPMSDGSGFFYRLDGQTYLFTARHCFSAKHMETGEYLGSYQSPRTQRLPRATASATTWWRGSHHPGDSLRCSRVDC
jgi:hypothetical protein